MLCLLLALLAPSFAETPLTISTSGLQARPGQTSVAGVEIRNPGTTPVRVTGLSLEQDGASFSLPNLTLPIEIAAGEQRTLAVRFAPTAEGPVKATLRVETSAGAFSAALEGVGDPDAPEMMSGIGGLIGAQGTAVGSNTLGGTTSSGDPIILGALDKSLIDAVIRKNMSKIRYCYQKELTKDKTLAGKLTVKFVVAKDGTVASATTKSTTFPSDAVPACVNEQFMGFQFPEPKGGGIVIVSYPFIFERG